jgi:hypothetical protein
MHAAGKRRKSVGGQERCMAKGKYVGTTGRKKTEVRGGKRGKEGRRAC